MGHFPLKVAALPDAVAFYRDVLGFDLLSQLGEQAAFLSSVVYHHHIGANTWESAGATQQPERKAALRKEKIVLTDAAERDRVQARREKEGHEGEDTEEGPRGREKEGKERVLEGAG